MKAIIVEVPYGKALLLPPECSQFLPLMSIVSTNGYGLDRETRRDREPRVDVIFIDQDAVLPPAAPEPLPSTEHPTPNPTCRE